MVVTVWVGRIDTMTPSLMEMYRLIHLRRPPEIFGEGSSVSMDPQMV